MHGIYDANGRILPPTQLTTATASLVSSGGYEAIQDRGKRKASKSRVTHEGHVLRNRDREKLLATTQDAVRNFSIASWVVRKHLDYVTEFNFQMRTDDQQFNDAIEAMIREKSKKENCDVAARHPLRRQCRMSEARRVIDGDIGVEKVSKLGQRRALLNYIEGDRIYDQPPGAGKDEHWINGVMIQRTGRSLKYAIWNRDKRGNRKEFAKTISAKNMYLHGYFDTTHRFDQVRGISPLSSALNTIRDISEGFDLSLMRIKVAQMFGLKITQPVDGLPSPDATTTEDSDDDNVPDTVNLEGGPFQLELAPGEDAQFLDTGTPAIETTEFLKLMIHVALKAIDLPFSFFDESHTNFFGSRGALLHYLRSCHHKIADNQDLLNWITRFWLGVWISEGDVVLPSAVRFEDLKWEWVPVGVPWWDPSKEVRGNVEACSAHMDNYERVCRSNGTDVYDNIRINARVARAAEAAGVPIQQAGGQSSDNQI